MHSGGLLTGRNKDTNSTNTDSSMITQTHRCSINVLKGTTSRPAFDKYHSIRDNTGIDESLFHHKPNQPLVSILTGTWDLLQIVARSFKFYCGGKKSFIIK